MKGGHLLIASAAMHVALALLVVLALIWWPSYAGRPLTGGLIGITLVLASYCAFLGFALLKARAGSPVWGKIFGIAGGVFVGTLTGFGGWKIGLIFGIPLIIGIAGLWRRRMLANSALLTDAYTSPLRAQRGAAKRGR